MRAEFEGSVKQLMRQLVPTNYRRFLRRAYGNPRRACLHSWRRVLRKRLVVVVGSSHRVGSTWLYNMVADLGQFERGIEHVPVEFRRFGTLLLEPEVYDCLRGLQGYVIFKSHSFPPGPEETTNNVEFLSIYRDPRDVLVSASFYIAHLEEEKGGWGESFRSLPPAERIQALMERSRLLSELEQWFRTPCAYKVRYEDLKEELNRELELLANHLGLVADRQTISGVVERHSFMSKSGRQPGVEIRQASLRKGIVGDWRNYFDDACIAMFKSYENERWNRLLVEMGYEDALDW